MILNCPKCASRFLLSAQVLGETGKKVKCTSCGNIWFQEPDEDALAELRAAQESAVEEDPVDMGEFESALSEVEAEMDDPEGDELFEKLLEQGQVEDMDDDIPSAIMPNQDADLDFVDAEKKNPLQFIFGFFFDNQTPTKARMGGYGLAALLFLSIALYVFANQKSYVREIPYMVGLYKIFGMEPDPPGKGLIFDDVSANIEGAGLNVEGKIINLYKDDQVIPKIVTTVSNKKGFVFERFELDVGKKSIKQGDALAFKEVYNGTRLKGGETFSIFFKLPRPDDPPEKKAEAKVKKKDDDVYLEKNKKK
ncbi:MAG: zinc-ribbon domain-containing protein [Pseudomonadota bacterium]